MNNLLTKSDFKVAQECPSKLFYKKAGMPNAGSQSEYMSLLADGGFMVGKMAQLLYANGIMADMDCGHEAALEATKALLESDEVVLFEATLKAGAKLARVDILEKKGNKFRIVEVKSRSFDSQEMRMLEADGKDYFKSGWDDIFQDVAFQKLVLAELYPEAEIECWLMMPDKSKTTEIEGLAGWFELLEKIDGNGYFRPFVHFSGDEEQLRSSHILTEVQVDKWLTPEMTAEVLNKATLYQLAITENRRLVESPGVNCSKCDYTVKNANFPQSGFEMCWGDLAHLEPHILKLARLGNFNSAKTRPIDNLIRQGRVLQTDVPVEIIKDKYKNRAYYQVYQQEEIFDKNGFLKAVQDIEYPLHFIDFETSQMAIPYHAGMRPYEKVCFQWSCHTITAPGAEMTHTEWINTESLFPNFEFAEKLRACLGNGGTVLVWSAYEGTVLKAIRQTMDTRTGATEELKNWLDNLLDQTGRILDLHKLAEEYYFHPVMGGRTSIKVTLPAVLAAMDVKKAEAILAPFRLFAADENGEIVNPYYLLPEIEMNGKAITVKEGTGAMRAYQHMVYGACKHNLTEKQALMNALLRYCHLDTLAMVLIWEHWWQLAGDWGI